MKVIPRWRRMHPETILSILLIMVALIAGMLRCGGGVVRLDLAISSTDGGNVIAPGEGNFAYDTGTVVGLSATADTGWRFAEWSGDVGTVADVHDASTTIAMNDDYSVIANFEAILPGQYTLTISSTIGGSVSTPGQGTFRYDAGTVVDLVAESEEGYKFFKWTGDIETVANVSATSTTWHVQQPMHFSVTMEGDYAITAHFILRWTRIEPGL
jgi:hypothetical protein